MKWAPSYMPALGGREPCAQPQLVTEAHLMPLLWTNRNLCRSVGSRRPDRGERRARWPRETRSNRTAWPHRAPGIYSKARGPGVEVVGRQLWARACEPGVPSPWSPVMAAGARRSNEAASAPRPPGWPEGGRGRPLDEQLPHEGYRPERKQWFPLPPLTARRPLPSGTSLVQRC